MNSSLLKKRLQQHLEILCSDSRGRHLGSDGEQLAVDYLSKEFESMGYEVAHEEFDAPGWRLDSFELTSGRGTVFPAYPCFYSCAGEVEGSLALLNLDLQPDIPAETFNGQICLAYGDFETVLNTNSLAERFDRAGVKALIIVSPYQDTFSTKLIRTPNLQQLLVFTVSRNTALDLARENAAGALFRMRITAENFRYRAVNVVARTGSKKEPEPFGAVAAHFDASPGIQGAADNASGTSALLELARLLKPQLETSGVAFEWVACNAEEVACIGHKEYLRQRTEAGRIPVWTMDIDAIGTYLGIMVPNVSRSRSLYQFVDETLKPFGLAPAYRAVIPHPFNLPGVPMIHFHEPKNPNGNGHYPLHSPHDDLSLVNPDALTSHTEAIASLLERLLEWQEPPRPAWTVVPLTDGHLAQIEVIVRKIWTMGIDKTREDRFGPIGGRPWSDWLWEEFKTELLKPGKLAFVTMAEGKVVGFFSGKTDPCNGIAEVCGNGVAPDWMGQGIGRFQMEHLLDIFRAQNMRIAEVSTGLNGGHTPARTLYESLGFEQLTSSVRYAMPL